VDIHGFFEGVVANGYSIGGITLTSAFLTGGVFSYDGVHPSSAGYSIIADQFISAINAQAGTDIPRPDLAGILFEPNVPVTGGADVNAGPWGYDRHRSGAGPGGSPRGFLIGAPSARLRRLFGTARGGRDLSRPLPAASLGRP
jgi:hypothetical protein